VSDLAAYDSRIGNVAAAGEGWDATGRQAIASRAGRDDGARGRPPTEHTTAPVA
jgi:hypothetical protein